MTTLTKEPTFAYKTEPKKHQRVALKRSATKRSFALLMEAGTMKTKIVLDNAAYLWQKGEVDLLLVFAPSGVHRQWVTEQVPLHLPDWCPRRAAYYRPGSDKSKREIEAAAQHNGLGIITFSIATLARKTGFDYVQSLLKHRKVMIVVDEGHHIRTPSAKTTRHAWKLRPLSAYRRLLTGTEIAKGYQNLYAQFRFLDPGIIGCDTYTAFKGEYCEVEPRFHQIVGFRNIDRLLAKIAPHAFVCEKKDLEDLPPQSFFERIVELTDEQRRLIRELKEQFLAELPSGGIIEAPLAITRLQKFQQIAGGHVQTGNGAWQPVPNHSLDAVVDLVEQRRGQVIVWAEWQPDIEQISKKLTAEGIKHVTYYGGNSRAQNDRNKDAFTSDSSIKVFVSSYMGSEGLNLQCARTAIFYTVTFDYLAYTQALSRNHRGGQTEPCDYFTLVRPGSTDRKLLRSLSEKADVAKTMRDPRVFKGWLEALEDD